MILSTYYIKGIEQRELRNNSFVGNKQINSEKKKSSNTSSNFHAILIETQKKLGEKK